MFGRSRTHPLPLSFLLLLPGIITVHGFLLPVTPAPWARSTIPADRSSSCLASSVAMNPATTTSNQPLAIHGDWQAFFDEEHYNLMYYFNTKTGDSQWEPPDDFPIPVLDSHAASPFTARSTAAQSYYGVAEQKNHHVALAATAAVSSAAAARQKKQKVTTQVTKEQPDVASVFFKAAFGFAATVAGKAAEAVADHVMKQHYEQQQQTQQQKQPPQQKSVAKKAENKPWWLSFFHQDKPNQEPEEPIRPRRLEASVPSSNSRKSNLDVMDLLSEVNEKLMPSQRTASSPALGTMESSNLQQPAQHKQASTNTANKKQSAFWSSWNNNAAVVAADEPTKPLVPPMQREQWLQEKLYADSLKRQENLRKSYRKVIENRSPTISLSALKRDHKKDWHQYLEDV